MHPSGDTKLSVDLNRPWMYHVTPVDQPLDNTVYNNKYTIPVCYDGVDMKACFGKKF